LAASSSRARALGSPTARCSSAATSGHPWSIGTSEPLTVTRTPAGDGAGAGAGGGRAAGGSAEAGAGGGAEAAGGVMGDVGEGGCAGAPASGMHDVSRCEFASRAHRTPPACLHRLHHRRRALGRSQLLGQQRGCFLQRRAHQEAREGGVEEAEPHQPRVHAVEQHPRGALEGGSGCLGPEQRQCPLARSPAADPLPVVQREGGVAPGYAGQQRVVGTRQYVNRDHIAKRKDFAA